MFGTHLVPGWLAESVRGVACGTALVVERPCGGVTAVDPPMCRFPAPRQMRLACSLPRHRPESKVRAIDTAAGFRYDGDHDRIFCRLAVNQGTNGIARRPRERRQG